MANLVPTNKTRDKEPVSPCGVFGLEEGSLACKAGEDVNAFMDRMVLELPEVLVKAEGSLEMSGAVFGCDVAVIKDLVKSYAILDEARAEGIRIAVAKNKGDDDAADAAKARALRHVRNVDNKIRIDVWKGNDTQKADKLISLLPRAISDYGGSETAIATALSLSVDEVLEAIASDPEFEELQARALVAKIQRIEDHLYEIAVTSQSPTAGIFLVKNYAPDRYSDKSEVKVSGFSKPPEIHELPNCLNVVNGGKKED